VSDLLSERLNAFGLLSGGSYGLRLVGWRVNSSIVVRDIRRGFRRGGNTVAVHRKQTVGGQYIDMGFIEGIAPDAETGPEGLEMFCRDRPDVVLLDLRLPGMDGQDVLRAIREESPDAAVIVLSGKGLMADVIAALPLGAWDYLTKPIHDLAVLGHSIRRSLERIRLLAENQRHRDHLEEEVRKRTVELDNANRALEAKSAALHEVLATIEAERSRVGRQIHSNVDRVILPILHSLNHRFVSTRFSPQARRRGAVTGPPRPGHRVDSIPNMTSILHRSARLWPERAMPMVAHGEAVPKGLG